MKNNKNFRAGMVSVTFRQYEYENLIKYVKLTDLSCIEWGSDIHLPYGEPEKAAAIAKEMKKKKLETASYGSYYHLGQPHEPGLFESVLKNAGILSAPMIRVWGGITGSKNLDAQKRQAIISDVLDIAGQAKKENVKISLEYHADTITDTTESALKFIKEVRRRENGDNVYLYWQPSQNADFYNNKAELMLICPFLSNIHVFAWAKNERYPLAAQRDNWEAYISIIKNNSAKNHDFLLEFVKGDAIEQMAEDAKVLAEMVL